MKAHMDSHKSRMKLTFVKPCIELTPYIQSIWIFESPIGLPAADINMAAPNGCSKLIFSYENPIISTVEGRAVKSKEHNLYFVGNRDISVQVCTAEGKTGFIGIEFYPHGAYQLFGIPMYETANRLLSADELIPHWGNDTNEQLNNIIDSIEKVNFIQKKLETLLRKNQLQNPYIEYCVNMLKASYGLISIAELEKKTGYSRRYLEMLFKKHVGFSPKVLAGIFRFQKFYKKWAAGQSFEEFKEELYNYYYDQSHFVKEFKRMTGFSPLWFSQKVTNEFGKKLSAR